MGLKNPDGDGGLTAAQEAKLALLPTPIDYDDGRPLIARSIPELSGAVVFALRVDGGSVTDVSDSAHTVSLESTADASSEQAWSGDESLSLNGSSDYLEVDDSADFNLTGDFIIQIAAYQDVAAPDDNDLLGKYGGSNGEKSWMLQLLAQSGQKLVFTYTTVGAPNTPVPVTADLDAAGVTVQGRWNLYRVVRHDDLLMMFVNEVLVQTADLTGVSINNVASHELQIGAMDGGNAFFDGHIDNVFIQNGGDVASGESIPQRVLYQNAAQVVWQAEQVMLPQGPIAITEDRVLSPIDGECVYVFDGAHTVTLDPMSTWKKWIPHFINNSAGAPVIELDDGGDTVDGVTDDITISTQYGQCKIRRTGDSTAIAEGRFTQP